VLRERRIKRQETLLRTAGSETALTLPSYDISATGTINRRLSTGREDERSMREEEERRREEEDRWMREEEERRIQEAAHPEHPEVHIGIAEVEGKEPENKKLNREEELLQTLVPAATSKKSRRASVSAKKGTRLSWGITSPVKYFFSSHVKFLTYFFPPHHIFLPNLYSTLPLFSLLFCSSRSWSDSP
jgi:hypothetical protein